MATLDNHLRFGKVPSQEELDDLFNDLYQDEDCFDSLAPMRWTLPSVPKDLIPGYSHDASPMGATTQSTSAVIAAKSPFPSLTQTTSQIPSITPTPNGDGFQSALFKGLSQQPTPSSSPSTPISCEFKSPMFQGLIREQTVPHLAYRAEGKEDAVRPSTPRMIMCKTNDRIPSTIPTSQILSESDFDLICSHFMAGEKTFKPRSGLEHPLHQEINKHVNALVLSPNVLKLDAEARAQCEQLVAEICQATILPIPQELIEVAVRYHMFKAIINNLGSCNDQQKAILFAIATGNGLFSLPQLDASERPLTVLGQVITKSNKFISDGIHTVATAAQSGKMAMRQLAKDASSSFKETFSLQRKPIDFSSVSLSQTSPATTSQLPTSLSDRSTPTSIMPTPAETVHQSLYPSLTDDISEVPAAIDRDRTPSEWVPITELGLTTPIVKRLSDLPPDQVGSAKGRIVVQYAGKEGDKLFIRGTGPKMGYWGEGIEMRQENGLWIYDSTDPFETFEFKLMLNNHLWEEGSNHLISQGEMIGIPTIRFHDFS